MDLSKVKDITVKAGQEFQIAIPFTATPKPTAKWELNGSDVEVSPRVSAKVRLEASWALSQGTTAPISVEIIQLYTLSSNNNNHGNL